MDRSVRTLKFKHQVIATDGTIFVSARDVRSRVENFIISRFGDVSRQVNRRFELVNSEEANYIRGKLAAAYIPVYRTDSIRVS